MKAIAIIELSNDAFEKGNWYVDGEIRYTENESLMKKFGNNMISLKPLPKKPNPVNMGLEPYIKPSDAEKWEFYCIGFNDALKEITE